LGGKDLKTRGKRTIRRVRFRRSHPSFLLCMEENRCGKKEEQQKKGGNKGAFFIREGLHERKGPGCLHEEKKKTNEEKGRFVANSFWGGIGRKMHSLEEGEKHFQGGDKTMIIYRGRRGPYKGGRRLKSKDWSSPEFGGDVRGAMFLNGGGSVTNEEEEILT